MYRLCWFIFAITAPNPVSFSRRVLVYSEKNIVVQLNLWCELFCTFKVYGMLIRHPEYFYVSRKGSRDTVFLRRAFEEIHAPGNRKEYCLIDKHPLVLVKEKFAALMEVIPMDSNTERGQAPFQERGVPEHGRTVPAQNHATTKIPWWTSSKWLPCLTLTSIRRSWQRIGPLGAPFCRGGCEFLSSRITVNWRSGRFEPCKLFFLVERNFFKLLSACDFM